MNALSKSVIICGGPRALRPELVILAHAIGRGDVIVQHEPQPIPQLTLSAGALADFEMPSLDLKAFDKPKEPWRRGRPLR
jgi:hypothetical protein